MIIAFSPPAPEKLHYLHCFPHTRFTLTAAGRSVFEQPSQSGVHDKYPSPPTTLSSPCPHLHIQLQAADGWRSYSSLSAAALVLGNASLARSSPPSRCCWPPRPSLVGKTDAACACACTRVSVETVWNSLLHASASSALPFSLFIVSARGEGRGLQDKRQKGFSHAAFLSNDRLEVTVCKLKWDRERNGDICSFVIFLHNRSCALRLSCAHRGSEGTTDAPHMGWIKRQRT